MARCLSRTHASYDTDAVGYAEKVRGLLEAKPGLRAGLTFFADLVRDAGFRIEAELVMRPDDEVPGAIIIARTAAAPSR